MGPTARALDSLAPDAYPVGESTRLERGGHGSIARCRAGALDSLQRRSADLGRGHAPRPRAPLGRSPDVRGPGGEDAAGGSLEAPGRGRGQRRAQGHPVALRPPDPRAPEPGQRRRVGDPAGRRPGVAAGHPLPGCPVPEPGLRPLRPAPGGRALRAQRRRRDGARRLHRGQQQARRTLRHLAGTRRRARPGVPGARRGALSGGAEPDLGDPRLPGRDGVHQGAGRVRSLQPQRALPAPDRRLGRSGPFGGDADHLQLGILHRGDAQQHQRGRHPLPAHRQPLLLRPVVLGVLVQLGEPGLRRSPPAAAPRRSDRSDAGGPGLQLGLRPAGAERRAAAGLCGLPGRVGPDRGLALRRRVHPSPVRGHQEDHPREQPDLARRQLLGRGPLGRGDHRGGFLRGAAVRPGSPGDRPALRRRCGLRGAEPQRGHRQLRALRSLVERQRRRRAAAGLARPPGPGPGHPRRTGPQHAAGAGGRGCPRHRSPRRRIHLLHHPGAGGDHPQEPGLGAADLGGRGGAGRRRGVDGHPLDRQPGHPLHRPGRPHGPGGRTGLPRVRRAARESQRHRGRQRGQRRVVSVLRGGGGHGPPRAPGRGLRGRDLPARRLEPGQRRRGGGLDPQRRRRRLG